MNPLHTNTQCILTKDERSRPVMTFSIPLWAGHDTVTVSPHFDTIGASPHFLVGRERFPFQSSRGWSEYGTLSRRRLSLGLSPVRAKLCYREELYSIDNVCK